MRTAAAIGLCCLMGCVVDEELTSAESSEVWVVDGTEDWSYWDSGSTAYLSPVVSADCNAIPGSTQYLLTGLTGWREPSGNLDTFVAKLDARCQSYNADFTRTSSTVVLPVYSAPHRSTTGTASFAAPGTQTDEIPVGLLVSVNSGNAHVRDLRMMYAKQTGTEPNRTLDPSTYPTYGNFMFGVTGTPVFPVCGVQQVLTGLSLRYDTRNGKIRLLQLKCADAHDD